MDIKRIIFGIFAYVFTDTDNTMDTRGVPSIALWQSNDNGGHYFMSLKTGKMINCNIWKELPISDSAISAVEKLGKHDKQPVLKNKNMIYEYGQKEIVLEDNNEMRVNEESTDFIYDITVLHNKSEEETNSDDGLYSNSMRLEEDGSYSDNTNLEDKGANDMNIKFNNEEKPTTENIKV